MTVLDSGTLYDAIRDDDPRSLFAVIRPTCLTGLDLVPGTLERMEFDHDTPRALTAQSGTLFFTRIADALAEVECRDDPVIIGGQPQPGFLTMAALSAATADAGLTSQTLYEVDKDCGTRTTHERAMESLNMVNHGITDPVKAAWGAAMTRKNLPGGLMNAPAAPAMPAPPHPVKGAVIEIDPFLIDGSSLRDRLEMDPAEDAALARSIGTYGQQVPVLVRPHPTAEGRFQIVYGRRRVLALRDLNEPVKALVRDLDDRDLALAQGQENTARRDLSFIEKAVFAQHMVIAGFERTIICDAVMIDKTVVSRMLSVSDRIPFPVIEAIGSAPSIGRDRWFEAAELWSLRQPDVEDMLSILSLAQRADTSDDRFMAMLQHLHGVDSRHKAAEAAVNRAADTVNTHEGWPMGEVKRTGTSLTLRFRRRRTQGFEDWLVDALPDLFAQWQNDRPPRSDDPQG